MSMASRSRPLHSRRAYLVFLVSVVLALLVPVAVMAAGSSQSALMISTSSGRGSAIALSRAQVKGNAYVFLSPTTGVKKASFWLDNTAMSGTATHVESSAPLDFVGTTSSGAAKPWDTTKVASGTHSITVKIVTSSGTTTVNASFSVANGTTATPPPTAKLTATPTAKPTSSPTAKPTATPTATPAATPTPVVSSAPSGFVGSSGTQLTLDGSAFTFTGFNIYQANSRSNCSYTMGTGSALDTALSDIGAGSEMFRSWFFQRLATTNGQRDWSAFDHTLAVAKAHGVKVIATLGNQWGSCESPTSVYKTDAWYKSGYKTDILPDTTVSYRQWVTEVVSRYKNDPTIAVWQLMNEAEIKASDAATSCSPTSDLYNFAADVSSLVKSIDPNHLVNLGTMGAGQCGSQGSDYKLINSISTLDVCEYHDYGHETEALPANLVADIAACNALNKPIFVGEAGIKATSVGGNLADRAAAFDAKCSAMFKAGVTGFLVWSWNNSASTTSDWPVGPGDPSVKVIDSH
jgi:hypothetical protein